MLVNWYRLIVFSLLMVPETVLWSRIKESCG